MNEQMNERMKEAKFPYVLQDFCPYGAAAQKWKDCESYQLKAEFQCWQVP